MEIRVLGPIEVHEEHPVAIGGPRQRRILGALAMHPGEVVSLDRLVDITWAADEMPENAERNVRTYVHRLRSRLGVDLADRIATSPLGYVLRVATEELDASRFEMLVGQADRVAARGDPASTVAYVDEALSIWRGDPYQEFGDEIWVKIEAARLCQVRIRALELRADALVRLDRRQDAVSALGSLIIESPYRERPRELLMLTLYSEGREAEALGVFRDFRALLVDEMGIEPSAALAEVERRILDHDPALQAPSHDRSLRSYELDHVIGEGAFAMVWHAKHPELHREVAIKQIRDGLANDPGFIRRFEVEAQVVSSLEHPHIVPLYDYWREPDAAYLVMRLLRGGTLEERIAKGPLDGGELVRLVEQIGSALRAAHRRGVVHRDVKPANVLLDEDANFYLTDFGIAVGVEGEDDAAVAMSTGSPFYASPEQLRRENLDARADVYALGVMLYEAGVGEHPFADEPTRAALVSRQMNDQLPVPSSKREDVPSWLDLVVARATTKAPRDRYGGIDELLADVGRDAEAAEPTVPRDILGSVAFAGSIRNPFKGLRAFQEADAADFFGRQRLVARFLQVLQRPGTAGRVVAAVGPSGSGKSSAVRAGLVPALRSGAISGSDEWFITTMMPGGHPFDELESALTRIAAGPPGPLSDLMVGHERGIGRAVKQVLPDESSELLLVIDQFEELFTLVEDESECRLFLDGLLQAISEPRSRLRVVVTIRADFWDKPLGHPGLAALLETAAVTVSPLAADELERAIVDPLTAQQMEYEPGLVARITADVFDQPGALPLLQFTLTELFDRNVSGLVLASAYDDMGAMRGAIAKRAEDIYDTFTERQQHAARRVLGRLVTLGEGAEDTRRRVTVAELDPDTDASAVIESFGSARLVAFDRDPVTRGPTVEIAHEALLRAWPRLRHWIDEDRDDLRVHRHLTMAAAEWHSRGRDDSELYRGGRLEIAEGWSAASNAMLNPLESEFLRASTDRRDRDRLAERRRLRRLHRLLVTTGVVALLALVAGALAFRQKDRADDQATLAIENAAQAEENAAQAAANEDRAAVNAELAEERAREAEAARAQTDLERLRTVAISIAEESPIVGALLAVEAHRIDPSVESLDAVHRVLTAVPGFRGSAAGQAYVTVELLDDGLTLAAVGPASIDIWDLRAREVIRSIPHSSPTKSALFDSSADGRIAAALAEFDETILYDLRSGESLGSLDHGALVTDISISPDGTRLAVAGIDGRIEIWDLASMSIETILDTGPLEVSIAEWSPTDDRLVVVKLTSEVQFWDPDLGEKLWSAVAPPAGIVNQSVPLALLFGDAGRSLAFVSGTSGRKIHVYDASDGSRPVEPIAFSESGGLVLDALYWIDEEAMVIGVPTSANIDSYDLRSGQPGADALDEFAVQAFDVVYSSELDRFVVAALAGLEFWSTDRSGPLERVLPLTAKQVAANAMVDDGVVSALAADGSQVLVSVFSPTTSPTTSFDLTTDPPTRSIFDPAGPLTLGFGPFTVLVGRLGAQILDPSNVALGPPVAIPFDFTDVGVSFDGRYFALGRLGGFADLYTGSGEFVATVGLGDGEDFGRAQTGATFTDDGEFMVVGTVEGAFGLWSTDPLERIDLPDPGNWSRGRLMGEWLFVTRTDGSFVRLDLPTFETVGEPVLNPGGTLIFARLDEKNLRVAAGEADGIKVVDLESGHQVGRALPFGSAARIEFTDDGSVLSVPGFDRVTLWNFDTDTWAGIACEMAGRNLTADEWHQFGPRTIERRATCPQYPLG